MMCSFPNPSSCLGQSPCSVNTKGSVQFSSVQFSRLVVSDSLWPHELQHTRPPCPSPTPGVYANSCPLSRWCHPAISSSVIPFSSCPCCTLPNGEPARVTSYCSSTTPPSLHTNNFRREVHGYQFSECYCAAQPGPCASESTLPLSPGIMRALSPAQILRLAWVLWTW